jgi:hypothetical protein
MTITRVASTNGRGDTQRKQGSGSDPSHDEFSQPTAHDGYHAVDTYEAKGIHAWAVLEEMDSEGPGRDQMDSEGPGRDQMDSKGPGRDLKIRMKYSRDLRIRMKYSPDEVASLPTGLERELWRAKYIERQSRIAISGKPKEVLTEMLFSVIIYLLGVAAFCKAMPDDDPKARAERANKGTKIAQAELARLSRFASDAELRSALKRYVQGLPIGLIAVILLGWLASLTPMFQRNIADIDLVRAFSAGAIGATVSVMIRITRGQKFDVDPTQGPVMTLLSGAFRPMVGAILGAALYVLLLAGLLHLEIPLESKGYFFAAVGFLGGFSERWAQDTIVRSVPMQATATNSSLNRWSGDTETEDNMGQLPSGGDPHSGSGTKNPEFDRQIRDTGGE